MVLPSLTYFATMPGCDQLDICPTNARGGTLDLLTTDVLELPPVDVMGNSDHSSLRRSFRWFRLFQTCVLVEMFSRNTKLSETSLWCNTGYALAGITFGLLTIILRCLISIGPCWLDVMTNQGHPCARQR